MSASLYLQIRDILSEQLVLSAQDPSLLKLRPPKEDRWGDLSSNVLQMLGGNTEIQDTMRQQLEQISDIQKVEVSPGRDLNIHFKPRYWTEQVIKLSEDGVRYGWQGTAPRLMLEVPKGDADLMALKRRWTAESLSRFAEALGGGATITETAELEKQGFNAKAALAKCQEQTLRLSLLCQSDDFAIHFSPLKAQDKSYDAPAFLLTYTYATVQRLLQQKTVGIEQNLSLIDEITIFDGAEEISLIRHLVGWPQILHKSLSEMTLVNLTGFLTEASLLFFKLYEAKRLQSSDYLTHGACAGLRRELLNAWAHLLGDALEALGHDRVKEFI